MVVTHRYLIAAHTLMEIICYINAFFFFESIFVDGGDVLSVVSHRSSINGVVEISLVLIFYPHKKCYEHLYTIKTSISQKYKRIVQSRTVNFHEPLHILRFTLNTFVLT